jgi:hypothetical protein
MSLRIELADDPELEELMELIADAASVSPAIYADLDALAEKAGRMLAELEERGLIRVVRAEDGTPIAAELLDRSLH